jgi:GntR family transcriptional regulator
MKLTLARNSPISIKDQIKRQIRMLIGSGEFLIGSPLPSARDMAKSLNVNRNTVAVAYRELAAEGILEAVAGSGTFIKNIESDDKMNELRRIMDNALENAVTAGFTPDQITDFILHRLTAFSREFQNGRILVVECNQEAIDDISAALKRNLPAAPVGVLIQDLEADPASAAEMAPNFDLIVCGFNHFHELKKIMPDCPVEIVAVMLKPDIRVINELMRLPAGTCVGFVCANQRSTETFFKQAVFSSGSSLRRVWAGFDNPALQSALDECDVIFASAYVYDRIIGIVGAGRRVIKVNLDIDPAAIDLVGERLTAARLMRRMA